MITDDRAALPPHSTWSTLEIQTEHHGDCLELFSDCGSRTLDPMR
ncbi:MAG: hypothetical protein ACI8ZB_002774 [Desulforhopalus sp.]|jgi:hypothetical protein